MKKPTHAFAMLIWIVAVAAAITDASLLIAPAIPMHVSLIVIWDSVLRSVWLLTEIAAAGVIIDLLDRLCWLATPEADRARLAGTYLLARWRRSRVP